MLYDLYWSPTGAKIATVEATTEKLARAKAPAPYKKYRGEIYAQAVPEPTCEWLEGDTTREAQGVSY